MQTDQYLLFDSYHPPQHNLGVMRTLNHRMENIPTSMKAKKKVSSQGLWISKVGL